MQSLETTQARGSEIGRENTTKGIAARFRQSLGIAAVAAGMVGTLRSEAEGAVVEFGKDAQSLAQGAVFATQDYVRQLEIDVPGFPKLHGTSTPLGSAYSGIAYHYIDDIFAAGYQFSPTEITNPSNPDKLFNIRIARGPSVDQRIDTTLITAIDVKPQWDFVLLSHNDQFEGARLPAFASASNGDTVCFGGFGANAEFGDAGYTYDNKARTWGMQLIGVNSNVVTATGVKDLSVAAGGPLPLDSFAPGHVKDSITGDFKLFGSMLTGTWDIANGVATGSTVNYIDTGLDQYILDNTPNNIVPEPTSAVIGGLGILGLLAKRRKR